MPEDTDSKTEKYYLGYLGKDITKKLALVSLLGYLKYKIQKPEITMFRLVRKLAPERITDDQVNNIATICEDFTRDCTEFTTFGLEDKEIPNQIKKLLEQWSPF